MLLARIVGALTKRLMDAFNVQIPPCTGLWILTWVRMRRHGNAFRGVPREQYFEILLIFIILTAWCSMDLKRLKQFVSLHFLKLILKNPNFLFRYLQLLMHTELKAILRCLFFKDYPSPVELKNWLYTFLFQTRMQRIYCELIGFTF